MKNKNARDGNIGQAVRAGKKFVGDETDKDSARTKGDVADTAAKTRTAVGNEVEGAGDGSQP